MDTGLKHQFGTGPASLEQYVPVTAGTDTGSVGRGGAVLHRYGAVDRPENDGTVPGGDKVAAAHGDVTGGLVYGYPLNGDAHIADGDIVSLQQADTVAAFSAQGVYGNLQRVRYHTQAADTAGCVHVQPGGGYVGVGVAAVQYAALLGNHRHTAAAGLDTAQGDVTGGFQAHVTTGNAVTGTDQRGVGLGDIACGGLDVDGAAVAYHAGAGGLDHAALPQYRYRRAGGGHASAQVQVARLSLKQDQAGASAQADITGHRQGAGGGKQDAAAVVQAQAAAEDNQVAFVDQPDVIASGLGFKRGESGLDGIARFADTAAGRKCGRFTPDTQFATVQGVHDGARFRRQRHVTALCQDRGQTQVAGALRKMDVFGRGGSDDAVQQQVEVDGSGQRSDGVFVRRQNYIVPDHVGAAGNERADNAQAAYHADILLCQQRAQGHRSGGGDGDITILVHTDLPGHDPVVHGQVSAGFQGDCAVRGLDLVDEHVAVRSCGDVAAGKFHRHHGHDAFGGQLDVAAFRLDLFHGHGRTGGQSNGARRDDKAVDDGHVAAGAEVYVTVRSFQAVHGHVATGAKVYFAEQGRHQVHGHVAA